MRVLTFLHSFEPGGVERVALRLVARWRALGIEAPLFVGRNEGPLHQEVTPHLSFHVPRQPRFGTAWWETLWMILTLPGHIRRTRPDVLFCAGSTYTVVAVALKLLLGRRCPPILAKISNDLRRADQPLPARLAWYAWLRGQSVFIDRWVAMEESLVVEARSYLGKIDCWLIHDPALDEVTAMPAVVTPGGGRRFVTIGRLAPQKDHALMLAAFAAGSGADDRLTIIGDGPLRPQLDRQAAALGITQRVHFAGHVPEAAAQLRDHDVFVLSSRYEGVPAVIAEALASGLAIIATDCGSGVRTMLENGRLGRIVQANDPAALARAIGDIPAHADPAAAYERASLYTLPHAADRYLEAVASLAADHRRGTVGDLSVAPAGSVSPTASSKDLSASSGERFALE